MADLLRAFDAGDLTLLESAATTRTPDPWLLVDHLDAADRRDVADAIARRLRDPTGVERAAMVAYLAQRASAPAADPRRTALLEATGAPDALEQLVALTAQGSGTLLDLRLGSALVSAALARDRRDLAEGALERMIGDSLRTGWRAVTLRAALRVAEHREGSEPAGALEARLKGLELLVDGYEHIEETGSLYLSLGAYATQAGDSLRGHRYFVLGEQCFRRAGDLLQAAVLRSNQGGHWLRQGDYARALSCFEQGRAEVRALNPPAVYRLWLEQRPVTIWEMLGDLRTARGELEALKALAKEVEASQPALAASLHGNLSRVSFLEGAPERALEDLSELDRLLTDPGNLSSVGAPQWLSHRAWYEAEGVPSETTVRALTALTDEPREGGPQPLPARDRVLLLEGLARCLCRMGRAGEAASALERGLALLPDIPPGDALQQDLHAALARALRLAGNPGAAWKAIDRYFAAGLGRIDSLEPVSGRTFRGIVARELAEDAVALTVADRNASKFWRVLEATRALRLLAALGGRTALERAQLTPEQESRLAAAELEEHAARLALDRTLADPRVVPGSPQIASLKAAWNQAEARRSAVALVTARDLKARDGAGPELAREASLVDYEAYRRTLTSSQALLSLSLASEEDAVHGLLLLKGEAATFVRIDGRAALLDDVLRLRRSPNDETAWKDLRERLSKALSLPVGVKEVHVVPDGLLCYVPFPALWPDRVVALAPSATALTALAGQTLLAGRGVLALGNPTYTIESNDAVKSIASLAPAARRTRYYRDLAPLKKSEGEARHAAGSDGVALIGPKASIAGFRGALAERKDHRWRAIHFACHGLIDVDFPMLSGLALSDGVLKAHDVLSTPLRADVVVLSACETATDAYVAGEGLAGLVRCFLLAGAPRVIGSLWPVPDEPTALLMGRFHDELRGLGPNGSVAAALRAAQSWLRTTEEGRWQAPQNWAGWVLWGLR